MNKIQPLVLSRGRYNQLKESLGDAVDKMNIVVQDYDPDQLRISAPPTIPRCQR
jgi:hypothetical protein